MSRIDDLNRLYTALDRIRKQASGKSTFPVFFSDVIRAFGSASVSHSICIETDTKGT
jgi:hypothetical protein